MPKISIILPNYNHKKYLQQRLESIFYQTYQDFEVILLDDASIDSSVELLQQYTDHHKVSHFIVNDKNSGSPFQQWKKGLELAKGEYIWIAESDDWAALDFLSIAIQILDQNSAVGLVYTHSMEVDENGEILGERQYLKSQKEELLWKKDFQMKGRDFIRKFLMITNVIPNASAVVFRRSDLHLSDSQPFKMKKAGDWYIWTSILLRSDVYFISKALNYFRTHRSSTRVYSNKISRKLRILEGVEILQFINTHLTISANRLNQVWKKLGNNWRQLYLYSKSIDRELLFPPFLKDRRFIYYFNFFTLEKKFYHLPFIILLPIRLLYLNLKSYK